MQMEALPPRHLQLAQCVYLRVALDPFRNDPQVELTGQFDRHLEDLAAGATFRMHTGQVAQAGPFDIFNRWVVQDGSAFWVSIISLNIFQNNTIFFKKALTIIIPLFEKHHCTKAIAGIILNTFNKNNCHEK